MADILPAKDYKTLIAEIEARIPKVRTEIEVATLGLQQKQAELDELERTLRSYKQVLDRIEADTAQIEKLKQVRKQLLEDIERLHRSTSPVAYALEHLLLDILAESTVSSLIGNLVAKSIDRIYSEAPSDINIEVLAPYQLEVIILEDHKYYIALWNDNAKRLYQEGHARHLENVDTRLALFEVDAAEANPAARPVYINKVKYTVTAFMPYVEFAQEQVNDILYYLNFNNIRIGSRIIERKRTRPSGTTY